MQRLFSMFPAAAPGAALVLLRVSAAVTLHLGRSGELAAGRPAALVVVLAIVSLALLLGFLTPVAAIAAAGVEFAMLAMAPVEAGAATAPLAILALALLGPGAYSLDAHLFGRRVLVLPRRTSNHDSTRT